jgi:hypothetical protein
MRFHHLAAGLGKLGLVVARKQAFLCGPATFPMANTRV